jgi:hypothetical protein
MTRLRLISTTSNARQQGHVTSSSLRNFVMELF